MKPILERITIREVLELSEDPTIEEVKKNYKRLALQYHPDRNKSPEALEYMKRLNQAYAMVLKRIKSPPEQPQPQPMYSRTIIVNIRFNGGSSTWTGGTGGFDGFNW